MRELTTLEIDQLDFSGRVPDLHVDDYQLIGLATENARTAKRPRKTMAPAKRLIGKRRLAKSA